MCMWHRHKLKWIRTELYEAEAYSLESLIEKGRMHAISVWLSGDFSIETDCRPVRAQFHVVAVLIFVTVIYASYSIGVTE